MVSIFTPNIQLEEPARGDQVGVWDTPMNGNSTLLDLVTGAITTISLNNSPVILAAAQFQSRQITFNSTLTGSVAITFPTSFHKSYEIQNLCTGSSAFVVTLATTAAGGQAICCPPGETIDCFNDGTNLKYKNLDRVGSYWDYAGSSVPAWVSGCTVPPYLNCTGGTFSAATYPALAVILGSTTLPDSRGRFRAALNQTTSRINSSTSGVNGDVVGGSGGSELLHNHNHGVTDPGHIHTVTVNNPTAAGGFVAASVAATLGNANTASAVTNITVNNSSLGGAAQNIPPAYIGGLTLIRAG